MIETTDRYIIDGWAVLKLVDIMKVLRQFVETKQSHYTPEEFLVMLDRYDYTILYLLNLQLSGQSNDTYSKDDNQQALEKLLAELNISINDINKKDELGNATGETNATN